MAQALTAWDDTARVALIEAHGVANWTLDSDGLFASRGNGHPIELIGWMERGTLLAWLS